MNGPQISSLQILRYLSKIHFLDCLPQIYRTHFLDVHYLKFRRLRKAR